MGFSSRSTEAGADAGRAEDAGKAPGSRARTDALRSSAPVQRREPPAEVGAAGGEPGAAQAELPDPFWFASGTAVQAKLEVEGAGERVAPVPAGGGAALDDGVRGKMERSFGADFSAVRVQADSSAAREVGARAYAAGDELHFAPGEYAPGTAHGDTLIGHELAHVVQQREGRVGGASTGAGVMVNRDAGLEAEADDRSARAARGEVVATSNAGPAPAAAAQAVLLVDIGDGMWGPAIDMLKLPGMVKVGARCRNDGVYYTLIGEVRPGVWILRPADAMDDSRDVQFDVTADVVVGGERGRGSEGEHEPKRLRGDDERGEDDLLEDDLGVDDVRPEERAPRDGLVALLGELLTSGNYVFNNPPLDSSGDIYHTLGFMALLRQGGKKLPSVVIGYFESGTDEKDKTEVHADRAVEFAQAIGFGEHVHKLAVKRPKSGQMNPKVAATREAILTRAPKATVIDQKVSTALISRMMQWIGTQAATSVIAKAFSTYSDEVPAETQEASRAWVDEQLRIIAGVVGDKKRLILFNERIATNQLQHNSEGEEFTAIRKAIADDPTLAHYTLRSHGGPPARGEEDASSPAFTGAGKTGKDWSQKGFNPKVQHVQLLLAVKQLLGDRLIGIYGSTSGTLDVAGLVGIRTLSLHQFPLDMESRSTGTLNEQDQRELLMAPFKDVLRRQGAKHALEVLAAWVQGTYTGPTFSLREIGSLKPLYGRAIKRNEKYKTYRESELELPEDVVKALASELDQAVDGGGDALAELEAVDDSDIALATGAATGVGMNCLIHTMVQLVDGAAGPPDARVTAVRKAMNDTNTAFGDEMLDPYEDGAGAALMAQFRRDGGIATQILQWQGGRILVHPVIGGGRVCLLLHRGNHFIPVWGNNGRAIKTGEVVPGDAAGSPDALDEDLQRAIAESLKKG